MIRLNQKTKLAVLFLSTTAAATLTGLANVEQWEAPFAIGFPNGEVIPQGTKLELIDGERGLKVVERDGGLFSIPTDGRGTPEPYSGKLFLTSTTPPKPKSLSSSPPQTSLPPLSPLSPLPPADPSSDQVNPPAIQNPQPSNDNRPEERIMEATPGEVSPNDWLDPHFWEKPSLPGGWKTMNHGCGETLHKGYKQSLGGIPVEEIKAITNSDGSLKRVEITVLDGQYFLVENMPNRTPEESENDWEANKEKELLREFGFNNTYDQRKVAIEALLGSQLGTSKPTKVFPGSPLESQAMLFTSGGISATLIADGRQLLVSLYPTEAESKKVTDFPISNSERTIYLASKIKTEGDGTKWIEVPMDHMGPRPFCVYGTHSQLGEYYGLNCSIGKFAMAIPREGCGKTPLNEETLILLCNLKFSVKKSPPDFEEIKTAIDSGHPIELNHQHHSNLITGYNPTTRTILVTDCQGEQRRNLPMTMEELNKGYDVSIFHSLK